MTNRSINTLILSSLVFIFAFGTQAEESKVSRVQTFTLNQVIQRGLENSPEVQKARSEQRESAASYSRVKSSIYPALTANASYQSQRVNPNRTGDSLGAFRPTDRETYATTLNLNQPLYSGGAMISGLRLGQTREDHARQKFYIAKQEVVKELVQAFYQVAQAEDNLRAAKENSDILKAYAGITRRYEGIGRAREMDRIQAEANHKLSLIEIENAELEKSEAQATLVAYLGLSKSEDFKLEFDIQVQALSEISFEDALGSAIENNPKIRGAELEIEEARFSNRVEWASELPKLSFQASFGYSSPDRDGLFKDHTEYRSVGINLTAPLFTGLSSFGRRREHQQRLFQAELSKGILTRDLKSDLSVAIQKSNTLFDQVTRMREVARDMKRALEMANRGYGQGVVSSQDVVTFQRSRFDTEKRLISKKYSYLESVLELRELLGVDLEKAYDN